jgi:hypothetical protein
LSAIWTRARQSGAWSADLADAFGDVVGRAQNLLGLLVEQQVIVAEMRTAHVPMEILGLEVERKRIGQDLIELGRVRADGVVGKIGRRSPCE